MTAQTTHPIKGLLHGPSPSPWDPDTILHGPDWRSRSGHTDGWWWATDTVTCCGIEQGTEYDQGDADQDPWAPKVLLYLKADLIAPLWAVEPRDLTVIGGLGRLRDWGVWDLDRVSDAAYWVMGGGGSRIVVAVDRDLHALRLVSPSGRIAVVMGVRVDEGAWFPTIDLPVEDAVAEYVNAATR